MSETESVRNLFVRKRCQKLKVSETESVRKSKLESSRKSQNWKVSETKSVRKRQNRKVSEFRDGIIFLDILLTLFSINIFSIEGINH